MAERLAARLRERIERDGPITFADFMEQALYDPDDGFYTRPPIGSAGHYVTSPHVSSAFGELLARQVAECKPQLATLTLLEAGAGDGTLAAQLLGALGDDEVGYVAVERSSGARAALSARGLGAVVASLAEVEAAPVEGVVLANELLDNVPFHRVRSRGGRLVEVFVGVAQGAFIEVEREPSQAALAALGAPPSREGEERPSSPGWRAWVRDVSNVLRRGWAIVIDYGFSGGDPAQSVRGYASQRVTGEVLADPGSRDVSTGVDFDVLAAEARACGLEVWGPVSQRDALHALGYRAWMDALRARQAEAEARGDHRLALKLFAERSRAPMLVDPAHLGGLQVLALGRDVPEPRITRG